MAQMLFSDPRFRNTSPQTPTMWSKQFLLKNREHRVEFPENWELNLHAVAAMGEAQVEDQLILTVDPEPPNQLPLWYLTQLWPKKFDLKVPLLLARGDKLWVRKSESLDSVDIAVVLFGHYLTTR